MFNYVECTKTFEPIVEAKLILKTVRIHNHENNTVKLITQIENSHLIG